MSAPDRSDDHPGDPAASANERVRDYWNDVHQSGVIDAQDFMSHPLVQTYTAMRAFEGKTVGQLDVAAAEIRSRTQPGDRVLSIGCGAAIKEEALAQRVPDRVFVAFDLADKVLEKARERIARNGITNLELSLGDFNDLDLEPGAWAAVVCLGSLHHVEALEAFWDAVRVGLKPGGVVLAHEYIGPNRLAWNEAQCEHGTAALRELVPAAHQVHHTEVHPTSLEVMLAADPSEAVRSSEILPTAAAAGWTLDGYAGAGGALLQPVLEHQIHTFDPTNWSHNLVLARLFERESELMARGILTDAYAAFVARPPG
jgi:SAM-dependent methyltransferase